MPGLLPKLKLLIGWSPIDQRQDWDGAGPQVPSAVAMASTSWPWHKWAQLRDQAVALSLMTLSNASW